METSRERCQRDEEQWTLQSNNRFADVIHFLLPTLPQARSVYDVLLKGHSESIYFSKGMTSCYNRWICLGERLRNASIALVQGTGNANHVSDRACVGTDNDNDFLNTRDLWLGSALFQFSSHEDKLMV